MPTIEYRLLPTITNELLQRRFECFNESLNYYQTADSALETFDANSFHLQFTIDGQLAGYPRLTPCPNNYMELNKPAGLELPHDAYTLEMGRTIVLPAFRGTRLLNLVLPVGLDLCQRMGYRRVIGNVSYEAHLQMPQTIGFESRNIVSDFNMPGSDTGFHTFYLVECNLNHSEEFRQKRLGEFTAAFSEKGYSFKIL